MMMLELCQCGEGDNCRFKVKLKRRLCSLGGGTWRTSLVLLHSTGRHCGACRPRTNKNPKSSGPLFQSKAHLHIRFLAKILLISTSLTITSHRQDQPLGGNVPTNSHPQSITPLPSQWPSISPAIPSGQPSPSSKPHVSSTSVSHTATTSPRPKDPQCYRPSP